MLDFFTTIVNLVDSQTDSRNITLIMLTILKYLYNIKKYTQDKKIHFNVWINFSLNAM